MKYHDVNFDTYFRNYPDANGYFGKYGGSYIPPQLRAAMDEITGAYMTICKSGEFVNELRRIRRKFQGRPTPVSHLERLSSSLGNVQLYAKREDLNHTGTHKLNHCMGEALLAKYMGKKKVIAETGAGQHGVALATAAVYFGLERGIYMGAVDVKKQAPNVARTKIPGARVAEVTDGLQTLKEAVDAAFTAYSQEYQDAIYCIGSVVGPHPFPMMVRDFQSVAGIEARSQFLEMTGELPDAVVACMGGGSNAMDMFTGFLNDPVDIYGVEPLGRGPALGDHAASLSYGSEGVMHGFNSIMLKHENGGPAPVYSVASGLDYPSSGPEHAFLHDLGRVTYDVIGDKDTIDAFDAFFTLSRPEGIIPAIESAHAVAYAMQPGKRMKRGSILINLSGRGDKDMDYVIEKYGIRLNAARRPALKGRPGGAMLYGCLHGNWHCLRMWSASIFQRPVFSENAGSLPRFPNPLRPDLCYNSNGSESKGAVRHARLYLRQPGAFRTDGEAPPHPSGQPGCHRARHAGQYLLQRPPHPAWKRAEGCARHHRRTRNGGCGGGNRLPRYPRKAGRPRDRQRGNLLRRVLFLPPRLGEQLHRSQRRLGAGLPH